MILNPLGLIFLASFNTRLNMDKDGGINNPPECPSLSSNKCNLPAKMLKALDPLEPGDRMQELHPHRSQHRAPVQEEQIPSWPRVLHRILYKVHNGRALELCEASKTKVPWKKKLCFFLSKIWYTLVWEKNHFPFI